MASVLVNIISRADDSGFTKATRSMVKMSAAATAVSGAIGVAGGAVGALGVGLAGVGALATPALAAVALGMDGIKKAATTARAPADQLKKSVSAVFASDMIAGFTDLGAVMGAITPQMQGVARATSGVFNGLASTIRANIPALQQLADGGAKFVTAMGPGINQLTASFIQFGAKASASATGVGAAFGGMLGRIGQAFNNLPVAQLMDTFASAATGIGNLVAQLVTTFGQLGVAMGPSLGALFTSLGTAIAAITPPLMQIAATAGPALAQTFTNLAPALGSVSQAFATMLSAIAPALPAVASLVSALAGQLGPALPVIVGAFVAYNAALKIATVATTAYSVVTKVIPVATRAWAAAQWLLNSALLANPLTWIVIAIVAVIAVIVLIATKTTWFQTIWQAMCTAAQAAWNFVVSAVQAGIAVLQAIWGAIVAYFMFQWNLIKTVATTVWQGIVAVVQMSVAVISAVVSAVVAALSAAWQGFQAAVSAVWQGIQAIASAVMNGISAIVAGVIGTVTGTFNTLRSVGSSVFGAISSAARAFGSAVSSIIGFVQSLISAIASIRFPSPPSWLTSIFTGGGVIGMPGAHAYMVPPAALRPGPVRGGGELHLSRGYPSLADLGGLSGRGGQVIVQQIDQSTTVKVDGSGIVDANKVAASVGYAVGRTDRTQGRVPSVVLGGAGRG